MREQIKIDGMSSVYKEPTISSTLKDNPYKSNVELEGKGKGRKGEIVLRPDLGAMHDVVGKRHHSGGVEAFIPEDSFIFSDYDMLALTEADHKLFELKEGGSFSRAKNTPAEVLRRNIDVKHYNKMSETVNNLTKDSISKNTATKMLTKYAQKLGQIAYIQEAKKDFPQGVPQFSEGTAPIYDEDLKEDIMEQKQYMQGGGYVNPFAPKVNPAITIPAGYHFNYVTGKIEKNKTNTTESRYSNVQESRASNIPPDSGSTTPTGPIPVTPWLEKWGKPGSSNCPPNSYWNSVTGQCTPIPLKPTSTTGKPSVDPLGVGNPKPIENIKTAFSPDQQISLLNSAFNYAGIRREMPMRSQVNSPLVELERADNQANFNRINNEMTSAYRANRVLNPYVAATNNAQVYGRGLDAYNEATANSISGNIQIANQQNLMNNQIQRQDMQANIGADQQYWQQSSIGRTNFDNARDVARNKGLENYNFMRQQNQSLGYNLAALGPNSPFGYNFRSGDYYLTGKGDIMGAADNSEFSDLLKSINQIPDMTQRTNALLKLYGLKTFQTQGSRTGKKGGRFNPYK